MKGVAKEDDTHKGCNSNSHGFETSHKNRPFLMYAPSQYTICHCISEYSLEKKKRRMLLDTQPGGEEEIVLKKLFFVCLQSR